MSVMNSLRSSSRRLFILIYICTQITLLFLFKAKNSDFQGFIALLKLFVKLFQYKMFLWILCLYFANHFHKKYNVPVKYKWQCIEISNLYQIVLKLFLLLVRGFVSTCIQI